MKRVIATALASVAILGCATTAEQTARDTLAPITAAADPAYQSLVVHCDAAERAIVANVSPGDDLAKARARIEHVRTPCRAAAHAFEAFREAQQAALSAAIAADACEGELSGACVAKAITALGHAIQSAGLARRAHRIAKTAMESNNR